MEPVSAFIYLQFFFSFFNESSKFANTELPAAALGVTAAEPAAPDAKAVALRIMPLGASVTFGLGSTTGDSYRKDLRDQLVAAGMAVEMVGAQRNGRDFADNRVEATPGFVISQIAASARAAVPQFRPNLVLLDTGTNNCNQGGTVPDAGRNVSALIDDIYRDSPGATVVFCTVLVTKSPAQDQCRQDVNHQYEALATERQQQ